MTKFQDFLHLVWLALKGQEQDYTRLNIRRSIVLLAIPMIMEMLMESLFAVVDIFFVGRLGSYALATIGLTESILMIIYSVGMGISMAGTALIARRFGEKNYAEASNSLVQLLITGLVLSVFLGGLTAWFAPDILKLMGADAEVLRKGAGYTRIIFAGNLAILMLFIINGAFRGAGIPHLAMRTLWFANGVNIVLAPLLIFGLGPVPAMGLEGAAIATVTARGLGVVYQLYELFSGKHLLRIGKEHLQVQLAEIGRILKVASGGMGQFLIDSASWIFLTRIMAEFGSQALAGYTIAFRIIMVTLLPAWGLSSAAATLVGQNLGAQKIRRAELSVWVTAKYNMVFMGTVTLLFFLFGKGLTAFFTIDPEVMRIGTQALRIITMGYIFFGLGMVMMQAFNGAGDTRTPAYINIAVLWLIEIPLAYLLALYFNLAETGIFIAIAICHSLHGLVSWFIFRKGNWKLVKV